MDISETLTLTKEQLEQLKRDIILKPLNSIEELRDWIYLFLDIYMPTGYVYHESTSSPIEAMWEIYQAVKNNTGGETPGYILLSARDAYKTLSASILEILLISHFRTTIAHCAAIESQSQKAVQYCNSFVNKILPYLKYHGWKQTSSNKRRIEFTTKDGEMCYIQIIILTMKGANCISPDSILHYKNDITKLAKNAQVGDKILTWDFWNNQDVEVTIDNIEYTNKPSREIIFEDGSNIIISDDNMVLTKRGWVAVANLRVRDLCKDFNIQEIYNTKYEKMELNQFSRDLDQLIIGTVLGDASICKIPSGKCRYSVAHCEKQYSYLLEIKKVFDLHNIECSISEYKFKHYTTYKLFTKTYPIFEKYYNLFYNNKIKTPSNVLSLLDYEGIAYWLMDDVSGNRTEIGKRKDSRFELATCCFSLEEHEQIVSFFNRLGYNCKIGKVKNSTKTYNIVQFDLKSSRDLSEKLEIYFINDLKYKLLPSNDISDSYRTIDQDELIQTKRPVFGFQWSDHVLKNKTKGRKFRKRVKPQINKQIKQINIIGRQNLINISINPNLPYLHSFYANNVLVHNSAHTNLSFNDEIDLCDPKAYQEAKMIPGVYQGRFPITVKLSSRKFAFGLMQGEIQNASVTREKILRWNILDVAEHCLETRCLPNEPKQIRYIPRNLPLRQLSEPEFNSLEENEKDNWEKIEAYQGCTNCPLLSVCKKQLHDKKPKSCKGDLWKPIEAIINVIRAVDPDVGEAQLLCHKPSSKGLIYPRFTHANNVVSIQQAWKMVSGLDTYCNYNMLIQYFKDLGVKIEAGVDWGYTNEFAITVAAFMPGGKSFVLYNFAAPNFELDDCVKIALEIQERFGVQKWWADQAYPAYIKTFNRKGLKCPTFKKDVPLGIESIRGRIIDSMNNNWMFILNIEENQRLISGFGTYHWKLDAQGNPTDNPDHTEESDIMDSIRYLFQNMYGSKKKMVFTSADGDKRALSNVNEDRMKAKIEELAIKDQKPAKKGTNKRIFWA